MPRDIRTPPVTKAYEEGYDAINWKDGSKEEKKEPQRSEAEFKENQEEIKQEDDGA